MPATDAAVFQHMFRRNRPCTALRRHHARFHAALHASATSVFISGWAISTRSCASSIRCNSPMATAWPLPPTGSAATTPSSCRPCWILNRSNRNSRKGTRRSSLICVWRRSLIYRKAKQSVLVERLFARVSSHLCMERRANRRSMQQDFLEISFPFALNY